MTRTKLDYGDYVHILIVYHVTIQNALRVDRPTILCICYDALSWSILVNLWITWIIEHKVRQCYNTILSWIRILWYPIFTLVQVTKLIEVMYCNALSECCNEEVLQYIISNCSKVSNDFTEITMITTCHVHGSNWPIVLQIFWLLSNNMITTKI